MARPSELLDQQFELPKSVEHFSLSARLLAESDDLRMDASFYNPLVLRAIETLERSGMKLHKLNSVTSRIFIPPRFKRIYVDAAYGIPFLQGSHVVHFQPADVKFLSKTAHRKLERWIIEEGWLLVTCSGTIGRVAICPAEWHGWAASQHILRIVSDNAQCPGGYLCSFLSSPIGQIQLTAQIYGAVVDELTEQQAGSVIVPIPQTEKEWSIAKSIDLEMRESVKKRSEAVTLTKNAARKMSSWLDAPEEAGISQKK